MNKTVLLTILDGWGNGTHLEGNAIAKANIPNFQSLMGKYPSTQIKADGLSVGLPEGQMGNSEVGHLNLGAGRVVYQELTRINKSIKDGDFFENKEFLNAIDNCKKNNSALHLMGLLSDGGVHSSLDHLFALIDLAKKHNLEKVYVHAFLDGRDTPPSSAVEYLAQLEEKLKSVNLPQIATISGRYYAMDRDNRWDRVQKAYNCLTLGEGKIASCSSEAIKESYANGLTDEFVLPTVTNENSRFSDNDSIIFFNYRPDRAREISRALNQKDFDGFERKKVLDNTYFVCFTQYNESFGFPIAFPPQKLTNILGEVLDNENKQQFRTAETEKYAHITFFFNGGIEKPFSTETRALVSSPSVATYDLQPEMSAYEVAQKMVDAINSNKYDFLLVNFANPDMVGHTGILEAAVKAVEAVDECVGKVVEAAVKNDIIMLLTADHGNAECMEDPDTHKPFTAHTTNPVPFVVINDESNPTIREGGALSDVAPTILKYMGIEQPKEMTGKSLV